MKIEIEKTAAGEWYIDWGFQTKACFIWNDYGHCHIVRHERDLPSEDYVAARRLIRENRELEEDETRWNGFPRRMVSAGRGTSGVLLVVLDTKEELLLSGQPERIAYWEKHCKPSYGAAPAPEPEIYCKGVPFFWMWCQYHDGRAERILYERCTP